MKCHISHLNNLALLLSIVGFFSCIALSLSFNHEEATRTHCGVLNYFPTISATVGEFSPQKQIWQFTIILSCIIRFTFIFTYFTEMNRCLSEQMDESECHKILCIIHAGLNCFELLGLMGLSLVSSSSFFEFHRNCFIVFLVCSFTYMLLHIYLIQVVIDKRHFGTMRTSLVIKRISFLVSLVALTLAMYFYDRHGKYCEEGIYSKFAVSEYFVVLSNMAFHWTCSLDMRHFSFCTTKCELVDSRWQSSNTFSPMVSRKRIARGNGAPSFHYKVLSGKT